MSVYTRGLKGVISDRAGAEETYYIYDGHGDVNMLMDSTGEIIKQYSYDAFGVEQNKDDSDTNPFRYCGEYFNNETESIYLRARYYNPGSGRFITEDPIMDGLNWYAYCGGNPLMFFDPWGLAAGDEFNSISDALFDAYVCLYGITDFAQIELGFALYSYEVIDNEVGEKKVVYSYTTPILGFPDGVKLAGLELRIPEGTVFNGYVHTHPGCENYMIEYSETFSGMDKAFIDGTPEGTDLYLLTQQGTISVLTSTGQTHIASTSEQRYEGTVISKDLNFKELNPMQKLMTSLRYGKAITEHINEGGCDFHDNDYLNRIEVDDIYNDTKKYAEFLVGKIRGDF